MEGKDLWRIAEEVLLNTIDLAGMTYEEFARKCHLLRNHVFQYKQSSSSITRHGSITNTAFYQIYYELYSVTDDYLIHILSDYASTYIGKDYVAMAALSGDKNAVDQIKVERVKCRISRSLLRKFLEK